MSRLTQRKAGRSDNNEAGKTPYIDASMAWRIGSMFEHRPGGTLVTKIQLPVGVAHRAGPPRILVFVLRFQPGKAMAEGPARDRNRRYPSASCAVVEGHPPTDRCERSLAPALYANPYKRKRSQSRTFKTSDPGRSPTLPRHGKVSRFMTSFRASGGAAELPDQRKEDENRRKVTDGAATLRNSVLRKPPTVLGSGYDHATTRHRVGSRGALLQRLSLGPSVPQLEL
jgi:hypothetical protein